MMPSTPKLNHEDLDVYRASIEFAALAVALLEKFPRGHAPLALDARCAVQRFRSR